MSALLAAALALAAAAPGPAGTGSPALVLSDRAVSIEWSYAGGRLEARRFTDRERGRSIALPPAGFVLLLGDGAVLKSSELAASPPRREGDALAATLEDAAHGLRIEWRAVLRDGARWVRQEIELRAGDKDVPISAVRLVDLRVPGLRAGGAPRGSPLVADGFYAGFEHPLADVRVRGDHGMAWLSRELPLKAGQSVGYSWVFGTARPGQLRRDFLDYLESERARRYAPILHYNSWYDLGYFSKYDEPAALAVIEALGEELVEKRGVRVDSLLFDDGWDDPKTLWGFHAGFPQGFSHVREAAARWGMAPGVWLSPWGGYGKPKQERLESGRAQGFETNSGGFALSGPRYFARFREVTLALLRDAGVNQLKIDGTGNADSAFPGAAFDSDFAAALALIREWREARPGLYVNLTTGTYPSPFWLRFADSIWRGGDDHAFLGPGSWRQRWITYRDADTYAGVVMAGPLFPLSSVMLHGLIYARSAKHLADDPGGDFAAEVRSYFGSGTQLQELYVTPALLRPADWDAIAEGARWARENADVLRDTHWIGGDPALLEPYGWASWAPRKGILVLRNPADRPQAIAIDVGEAFELPAGAPRAWRVLAAPGAQAPVLRAGRPHRFGLRPFEVLRLELAGAP